MNISLIKLNIFFMNISFVQLYLIMKILLIHLYLLNINISLIQLYIIMN